MEDTPAEVIARRMQAHLAPTTGVIAADAAHQGEARSEGFGVSDTHMADAIRRRWLPHDDSPAAPEALPLVQARRSTPPAENPAGAASSAAPAAQHAPSALPHAVAQRRPAADNPAGAASGTVPAAQKPQRALPQAVAQRRPSPAVQVGASQDLVMRPHDPPEPTAGISAETPGELQTGTRAGASAGTPAPDNARQAPATTAAMTGSAASATGVVQASRLPDGALLMRAGSSRGRAATAPAITPALTPAPMPAPTPGQAQGAAGTQPAPYPDMPLQAAPAGGVDMRGGALPGTPASPAPAAGSLPRVHVASPRIQAGSAQTNPVQAARVQSGAAQPGATQPGTSQPSTDQPGAGQTSAGQSTVRRTPSESIPAVTPAAGASGASVRDPGSAVWGKPIVQRRPGAQASQTPRIEVQAAAGAPLVRRWSAEPASGQIPSGQAQAGHAQAGQAPVAVQADVPVTGYPPAVQLTPVRPPEGQASTGAQTAAPEQPAVDQAPSGQASSAQAPPAPAMQVVASEPTGVSQGDPLPLVRGSAAGAAGNEAGANAPGPADLVQRQAAAGLATAAAATPAATATITAAGIAPGTVLRTAAAARPGAAPLSAPNGAAPVLRRTPQTNGSTRNPAKEERAPIPVVTAELPAISSVGAPQPPMAWHASSSSADAVQTAAAGTRAVGDRLPLQRLPLGGSSSAASSPTPSSTPPAESSSPAASSSSASMAAPPAGQTAGENAGDAAEVNVERVADAVYAILRDRLIIERESRGLGPI